MELNDVMTRMIQTPMPAPHHGSVMTHGIHTQMMLGVSHRLSRVLLYHDMGRPEDNNDHPSIGARMAQELGFEQWEIEVIHYHHGLYNLANLVEPSVRAIRRFANAHRYHLDDLESVAHADIFGDATFEHDQAGLEQANAQWARIQLILTMLRDEHLFED